MSASFASQSSLVAIVSERFPTAMARLAKESQPSRSSLRVATVRSLKVAAQSGDTSSRVKVTKRPRSPRSVPSKPSTTRAPSPCPALGSPKGDSPSHVPRLDRSWVIYDLSGQPFVVNPARPSKGMLLATGHMLSDLIGMDVWDSRYTRRDWTRSLAAVRQ